MKIYESPEMNITLIGREDIVCTSPNPENDGVTVPGDNWTTN